VNNVSALAVAVLAALLMGWANTALREPPIRIVPAPLQVTHTEPAAPAMDLDKAQALETLSQVSVGAMDRQLFLKSFAAAR